MGAHRARAADQARLTLKPTCDQQESDHSYYQEQEKGQWLIAVSFQHYLRYSECSIPRFRCDGFALASRPRIQAEAA
jgi:hypothetical protein